MPKKQPPASDSIPAMLTRLERGMLAYQAAAIGGVTAAKWSEYKAGHEIPTLRTLQRIADGHGVEFTVAMIRHVSK